MNTDFHKTIETIPVPENLVSAAITRGIGDAAPRKRRTNRRHWLIMGAAAAVLLAGTAVIAPVSIQAGGIIPAFTQLLDKEMAKTHYFDDTMDAILGDLADTDNYHKLSVPAQEVGGIKVQPIGTITMAGVAAVIVDYTGPGIQPDHLRQQMVKVQQTNGQAIMDTNFNFGKIALGHYRQVIAFYTIGPDPAAVTGIKLQLTDINGVHQTVDFGNIPLQQPPMKDVPIQQTISAAVPFGGKVTGHLVNAKTTATSMVINYTTAFTMADGMTKKQISNYQQAAWISEAKLVDAAGKEVGMLKLASGGQFLNTKTTGKQVTTQFSSTFAKIYTTGAATKHKLTTAPAGTQVKFVLEIPGKSGYERQTVGSFTMPLKSLLEK